MRSVLKFTTFAILALSTIIALTACSSGPSTADAEKQIKDALKSPYYDVVSVHVTGSKESKLVNFAYDVEYEYEVTFKNDFVALMTAARDRTDFIAAQDLRALRARFSEFKAGETKKATNTAFFAKAGNGWKMDK